MAEKDYNQVGKEYHQTLGKHGYSKKRTGGNFSDFDKGIHTVSVHHDLGADGHRVWSHSIGGRTVHTGRGEADMHTYLSKLHGTSQHSEQEPTPQDASTVRSVGSVAPPVPMLKPKASQHTEQQPSKPSSFGAGPRY